MRAMDWTTPRRLRQLPAGAELLPAVRMARRISSTTRGPVSSTNGCTPTSRRTAPTRSCPRMWGGMTIAAELRAIADVVDKYQHPDGEGDRRPAHRSAGRAQGATARRLARPERGRHGLRPRLRQGAAHGEDLRRIGMVPLRHAGFHRHGHRAGEDDLGLVDAAQDQDGGVRLPAQLRRGDDQGFRRRSPPKAAGTCMSAATAASRCASPTCWQGHRPRTRCWNIPPPSCSSTARRRWYLERTAPWVERVGIDYVRTGLERPGAARLVAAPLPREPAPCPARSLGRTRRRRDGA